MSINGKLQDGSMEIDAGNNLETFKMGSGAEEAIEVNDFQNVSIFHTFRELNQASPEDFPNPQRSSISHTSQCNRSLWQSWCHWPPCIFPLRKAHSLSFIFSEWKTQHLGTEKNKFLELYKVLAEGLERAISFQAAFYNMMNKRLSILECCKVWNVNLETRGKL